MADLSSTNSVSRASQSRPAGVKATARWTRAGPGRKVSIKSGPSSSKAWMDSGIKFHNRLAWSQLIVPAAYRASTSPVNRLSTSRKGRYGSPTPV